MQNLNETNKQQENLEGAKKAPSKFGAFVSIALAIVIFVAFLVMIFLIIQDNISTKRQIKANYEKALQAPEIQEYYRQEAKRQRELAQQRRLRQLGIDGVSKPKQKNDLLNAKLAEQEIVTQREKQLAEQEKTQAFDYSAEVAAYNAKLKEVQAEEARLKAEAEAKAKAQAEQERLRQEKQKQEQERAAALQKARELERIKAQKAAKANAAKMKLQTFKTERKTLQTSSSN